MGGRAGVLGWGLVAAIALAGCGAASGNGPAERTRSQAPKQAAHRGRKATRPVRRRRTKPRGAGPPSGLAFSKASNYVVQPQEAARSCHPIGTGPDERPDPRCTPGALNPGVRQGNISSTICVAGWTATVRPAEAVTETEKRASLTSYGDSGPLGDYEYDHLVPLELGGATNDPRNLWPEPGASPNPKDAVELALRDRVCAGQMSLTQAQREIASDWVRLSRGAGGSTNLSSSSPSEGHRGKP